MRACVRACVSVGGWVGGWVCVLVEACVGLCACVCVCVRVLGVGGPPGQLAEGVDLAQGGAHLDHRAGVPAARSDVWRRKLCDCLHFSLH